MAVNTLATADDMDERKSGSATIQCEDGDDTDVAAVQSPAKAESLDIEYRYLTFETPLPTANAVTAVSTTPSATPSTPPPPPPNLARYSDPHLWPESIKNVLLALSCIATSLTAYAAGSFSPAADRLASAYGMSLISTLASGITMFCIGFGLAPMLLAPLSETNGRYPVFVASGIVAVVSHVICGASPAFASMLIGRLFVGVGSSVFSTMVGGVIADMWHAAGRNTPMAIYSGFVMIGTGLGPFLCSIIVYHTTAPMNPHDVATDDSLRAPWRWVFWHQVVSNSVLVLFLTIFFRESRGSVLLSRRAAALNRWYGALEAAGYFGVWVRDDAATETEMETAPDETTATEKAPAAGTSTLRRIRWLVQDDENRTTILHMIAVSASRPFHMLVTEPVVFFFSLWVSFSWAVLYLQFGSIFLVYEDTYGWNMETSGRAFIAIIIGSILATGLGVYQDRLLQRALPYLPPFLRRHFRFDVPEQRLYGACLTAFLLPAGLFTFGFSADIHAHWIFPMIGVALATAGIYTIYLATFNYLADVYHRFASSALAAQSFCRNMLGGIFPLIMRPLYVNLGAARAGGLLGGIAIGLTLVPWVLTLFGERIRHRSKFAMALVE